MPVNINTNIAATSAQRSLSTATKDVEKSMEKLSSGNRINSAKDDAAGLQLSNRLQTQENGLDMAMRNANDGISISQTAEGAMDETSNILQRMRDLSLQSANGSNSDSDREAIQEEVNALQDEINRIAETTSFGGKKLLNGTFEDANFQVGASAGETIKLDLNDMRADSSGMSAMIVQGGQSLPKNWTASSGDKLTLNYKDDNGNEKTLEIMAKNGDSLEEFATMLNGRTDLFEASVTENNELQIMIDNKLDPRNVSFGGSLSTDFDIDEDKMEQESVKDIDVSTVGGSQKAISIIDESLKYVDSNRASLGAIQNRLDHTINNLSNVQENVAASKGRIKDTDYAKETTELLKNQILQQSSAGILGQARISSTLAQSLL